MAKQNSSGPELGVKTPTTPKGTNVEERAISVVTYTDVNIKGRCVSSNNNIMWAPQLLDIALAKVSGRLNDWLDSYLGLGWVIEKYIYITRTAKVWAQKVPLGDNILFPLILYSPSATAADLVPFSLQ